MISPSSTFFYQFVVETSGSPLSAWTGQGVSQTASPGLAGPSPSFEVRSGWLTLFPPDGWTHSLPIHEFSDQPKLRDMDEKARLAAMKTNFELYTEAQNEAAQETSQKFSMKENWEAYRKEERAAMQRALRRRGLNRDLASYSLLVGESLSSALCAGDQLHYSRDGNADFRYSVERKAEIVFSAGTVGSSDPGGPMAVWQEYDRYPNANAEALKKKFPRERVAEWLHKHKEFVSARIHEQQFHLLDGQEAQVDPYFIFLARSNRKVTPLSFEFTPRAVHAAGRLDVLSKDQIIDAAQKLLAPKVELL